MKKITNKDRYTAIIATLTGAETEIATDELVEFCQKQIDALDRKSVKAKEKADARKEALDELTDTIYGILTDEPMTINEILEILDALGNDDLTNAKISNRCSKLAKAGRAVKSEVTIPGDKEAGTKARKLVAYARA